MLRSLRIGSIFGVSIAVHWTWIVVCGVATWSLAVDFFPDNFPGWETVWYWITAAISSLVLLASVVVHELSHSLVSRSRGLPVRGATVFVFGGISDAQERARSPLSEVLQAMVGPLVSVALGVLFGVLFASLAGLNQQVAAMLVFVAMANLLLGLVNMIPGFPLDGGRLLRSLLWFLSGNRARATRVSLVSGQVAAGAMVVAGVVVGLSEYWPAGLWLFLVGWLVVDVAGVRYSRAVREQESRWES